jgi:succinoglycan biosynthesis protein ExoM
MSELPSSVDVCIATYKRPSLLSALLQSLALQDAKATTLRIIVIDNDAQRSAEDVVQAFRGQCSLDVVYDVEPRQSISHARNRALSHVRSDFFAFLDDDEAASPAWLRTIVQACQDHRADAVFGPVFRVLPPDPPSWATRHSLFRPPSRPTGTPVIHGGAGNVLIRTSSLGNPPQQFDPQYGLTGGEDFDFFYRMHLAGRRLIWCDEAAVHETVPVDRVTLKWIRQRSFRAGQSFFRVYVSRYSPTHKVAWAVRKVAQLGGAALLSPFARMVSYPAYTELQAALCRCAGQLSAPVTRWFYKEYDAVGNR